MLACFCNRLEASVKVFLHKYSMDRQAYHCLPMAELMDVAADGQKAQEVGRKEMFYLTTHSTHFIYGYMASDIW